MILKLLNKFHSKVSYHDIRYEFYFNTIKTAIRHKDEKNGSSIARELKPFIVLFRRSLIQNDLNGGII